MSTLQAKNWNRTIKGSLALAGRYILLRIVYMALLLFFYLRPLYAFPFDYAKRCTIFYMQFIGRRINLRAFLGWAAVLWLTGTASLIGIQSLAESFNSIDLLSWLIILVSIVISVVFFVLHLDDGTIWEFWFSPTYYRWFWWWLWSQLALVTTTVAISLMGLADFLYSATTMGAVFVQNARSAWVDQYPLHLLFTLYCFSALVIRTNYKPERHYLPTVFDWVVNCLICYPRVENSWWYRLPVKEPHPPERRRPFENSTGSGN